MNNTDYLATLTDLDDRLATIAHMGCSPEEYNNLLSYYRYSLLSHRMKHETPEEHCRRTNMFHKISTLTLAMAA